MKTRVCKKHKIQNCTLHKKKPKKKKRRPKSEPVAMETIQLDPIEMVREAECYELTPDLIVLRYSVAVCLNKNVGIKYLVDNNLIDFEFLIKHKKTTGNVGILEDFSEIFPAHIC